jgi:hypothetical protein
MAIANGLNPKVSSIGVKGSASITGGAGTNDATIKALVGTLPPASIYLATDGKVWVMQTTTWTQLTIS